MAARLNKDQCKELFKQFDNGNGILSLAEVDRAIIQWYPQFGTNRQAMMRAFKAADLNQSGFVELAEFSRLIELLSYYNELRDLFGRIDLNDDRRINFDEFRQGHQQLDLNDLDNDQLKEEFNAIDTNHGGFILFDEFCIHMATKKLH